MPRWLKLILVILGSALCVVAGFLVYVLWYTSDMRAAMAGRAAARLAVAHGHYRFVSAGLMTSDSAATGHSRDNYGIEIINTGCIVTSASEAYRKAYNQTMRQAVIQHFGRDVTEDKNRVMTNLPY